MSIQQELNLLNAWGVQPKIPYTSVYKIIEQFVVPFDKVTIAAKVAKKRNKSEQEILNEWEFSRKWGAIKGQVVHQYLDKHFGGTHKDNPEVYDFLSSLNAEQLDTFNGHIKTLEEQVERFLKKNSSLIPLASEFWLCDPELGIRGVADTLMEDRTKGKKYIFDWKTNNKISFVPFNKWNPETFLGPLSFLPKTDVNFYGLQTNIYKRIIEKNSTIKIDDCCLVWFNENNSEAQKIVIPRMDQVVDIIFNERQKEIENGERTAYS